MFLGRVPALIGTHHLKLYLQLSMCTFSNDWIEDLHIVYENGLGPVACAELQIEVAL